MFTEFLAAAPLLPQQLQPQQQQQQGVKLSNAVHNAFIRVVGAPAEASAYLEQRPQRKS
jgi:hypothetical protein